MVPVNYNTNEPYILMADDDEDDKLFMQAAFKEVGLIGAIKRFNDGSALLDFLKNLDKNNTMFPALIILDLNMPKQSGKEALQEIKNNERLKQIPVIIYSTSKESKQILETYKLGCNGYIVKPNNYTEIKNIAHKIKDFYIDSVNENVRPNPKHVFKLDL